MIEHKSTPTRGAFHYFEDGKEAGIMTYSKAGDDMIIIDHTEVFPEFNGKGIGKKLVLEGVKYARENNLKIIPLCPFASALFKKTPEIRDVLA
ncbi:MAG: GNAT family N-acetyltransferase [Flavobacteriales bacterium]